MNAKIDIITIGVTDLDAAREFYESGFGCHVEDEQSEFVAVRLGANASQVVLQPWQALAANAGVSAKGSGFRGFTLSYIVDSAEGVDEVLAQVVRAGGEVSKPPKSAFWGYSAYVTDPDGHLWKIASSKRRPLIARGTPQPASTEAKEVPITLGVADMKQAKSFYGDALGFSVKKDYRKFVSFSGADGTSDLGLYTWDALANDAATSPTGSGFRGFSLTQLVDSAEDVAVLLDTAARAGATVVTAPSAAATDGSGCFADPDGFLWRVMARTRVNPNPKAHRPANERGLSHARS
jgi:hypothetical protein